MMDSSGIGRRGLLGAAGLLVAGPLPARTIGLRHRAGTISVARNAPGTATADFFICASPAPYLDAHPGAPGDNQGFAAFGTVVEGLVIVRKILALPTTGTPLVPAMKGQMLNPPVQILGMKRSA